MAHDKKAYLAAGKTLLKDLLKLEAFKDNKVLSTSMGTAKIQGGGYKTSLLTRLAPSAGPADNLKEVISNFLKKFSKELQAVGFSYKQLPTKVGTIGTEAGFVVGYLESENSESTPHIEIKYIDFLGKEHCNISITLKSD